MTPLLSTDIKVDPTGTLASGEEFVISTTSEELRKKSIDTFQEVLKEDRVSGDKPLLKAFEYAAFGVALGLFFSFLVLMENPLWTTSVKLIYFSVLLLLVMTAMTLNIVNRHLKKNAPPSEASEKKYAEYLEVVKAIQTEQGLSVEVEGADVLCFAYEYIECEDGREETKLLWSRNPYMSLGTDEEYLYLSNRDYLYAFPRKDFQRIRKINEKARLTNWNRDFSYKDERAKEMGVCLKGGALTVDSYCVLEIQGKDRLWGLCVPAYELPLLERLTEMTAES